MFGSFKWQWPFKRGASAQKTRRRRTESELIETLEHGIVTKILIVLVSTIALGWIVSGGRQSMEVTAVAILMFGTAVTHLALNRPEIWGRNSRLFLLLLLICTHLLLVKYFLSSAEEALLSTGTILPGQFSAIDKRDLWRLSVPFAFAPLMTSLLMGRTVGIISTVFVTFLSIPVCASVGWSLRDVLINTTAGMVCGFAAVFLTLEVRKRGDLLRAGLFIGLTTWLIAVIFQRIIFLHIWMAAGSMNWSALWMQTAVAVGGPIILALVIYGALSPIESLFSITTNISWLELSDLNHPLLKRMTMEAPGTFQHSLAVANLAEAACEAIGANATMGRVCSYFHDIGKLVKPEYFTENMRNDRNPHEGLAPTMSALIIIAHVKEGVSLGLEYKLNPAIIDVIQQHHGTSMVYYFYKKAVDQQESMRGERKIAAMHDEELPEVSESSFRYGGPKAQSKESAIISLADSIESASRSLEKVTPQKIEQLVSDIVRKRISDGQLEDCELSFSELQLVTESFRHTISSMMHTRIAYPEDKSGEKQRRENAGSAIRQRSSPASAA